MKSLVLLLSCLLAFVTCQNYGCDCGGDHCLVGGRLYWSHEGIGASFQAWVQASFVPEAAGGGTLPTKIDLQCTGEFVSNGVTERATHTLVFSSFYIPAVGLQEFDLIDFPDVLTPLGNVHEKWGNGEIQNVEAGSWFECCWTGQSRYTPLGNADDCAPYNLCIDADLRATNEGPKPRGVGAESGIVDRLFESGFIVASICDDTSIDLEAVDETAGGIDPLFLFEPDPTKPGTNSMAEVNGVEPYLTPDGQFVWELADAEQPEEGLDGVFSVNVIVREQETAGDLHLNGTMDIDFIVALDPTLPMCEFSGIAANYDVGDTVSGFITVDDRAEHSAWRSDLDLMDIVLLRSSDPFDSEPSIPFLDASTAEEAMVFTITTECSVDGTFSLGISATDTCGHSAVCTAEYTCIAAPTEAPTDSPTDSPTDAPTDSPTDAPTDAPTDSPTDAPTDAPTDSPTDSPTDAPTDSPTDSPTDHPTEHPTEAPTVSPTDSPTDAPTDSPTSAPTEHPTDSPTDAPTESPTQMPTEPPIKSGCNTTVDSNVYFLADDHWIVPVGWTFEAVFMFQNNPPYSISNENNAPGAYEDPEIPDTIDDLQQTVNAFYDCVEETGGDDGEYLHLEYGFEKPVSGYCDTLFECCDVGCEFTFDNDNPPCGGTFEGRIEIHACPDARVRLTELTDSRAEIVNIDRTWRDGDNVNVNFECPEFRNDGTTIEVMVEDQYGGVDTCSMSLECEFCLKTCDCPMCSPDGKAWVCYVDGDGDIALYAMTPEELAASEDHMFYPTETYKGTQFDCYCEPVIEYPPSGSAFICHQDGDKTIMTVVPVESRPGELNDLEDYLNEGDGFPGQYNTISGDSVFLDGWCQPVA